MTSYTGHGQHNYKGPFGSTPREGGARAGFSIRSQKELRLSQNLLQKPLHGAVRLVWLAAGGVGAELELEPYQMGPKILEHITTT